MNSLEHEFVCIWLNEMLDTVTIEILDNKNYFSLILLGDIVSKYSSEFLTFTVTRTHFSRVFWECEGEG